MKHFTHSLTIICIFDGYFNISLSNSKHPVTHQCPKKSCLYYAMVQDVCQSQKEPSEKTHLNKNILQLLPFLLDFLRCHSQYSFTSLGILNPISMILWLSDDLTLSTLTFLLLLRIHSYVSLLFFPRNFTLVRDLKNPGIIRTLLDKHINKCTCLLCLPLDFFFFFLYGYETILVKGRNTKEK